MKNMTATEKAMAISIIALLALVFVLAYDIAQMGGLP